jgi:hypothetical protein
MSREWEIRNVNEGRYYSTVASLLFVVGFIAGMVYGAWHAKQVPPMAYQLGVCAQLGGKLSKGYSTFTCATSGGLVFVKSHQQAKDEYLKSQE